MGHDAFHIVDVITNTDGERITSITYYGVSIANCLERQNRVQPPP
jgi:hypothetical protein